MKHRKKLILFGTFGLLALPLAAQLPDVSTSDSPKWYYIRVVGDAARANRVFTVNDANRVTGQARSSSTDMEEVAKQLWRFEKNAAGRWEIINFATGLHLGLTYDSEEGTGLTCLKNTAEETYAFNSLGEYYQIESNHAAPQTPAGEVYLHQGNSGYNYAVITVGTNYGSGINSSFSFVPFVDFRYELSDGETQTYYHICNAGSDFSGGAVTRSDASSALTLTAPSTGDYATQWRAEATPEGGVKWINRATEEELRPAAMPHGLFNLLQPGAATADNEAWTLTHIGEGQYTFTHTDDDGVERYMGADFDNAASATLPDPEKLNGSAHAWTLVRVETIATGVDSTEGSMPVVRVENGRIIVSGNEAWSVYGVDGVRRNPDERLMPGLYIVKCTAGVKKVIVK